MPAAAVHVNLQVFFVYLHRLWLVDLGHDFDFGERRFARLCIERTEPHQAVHAVFAFKLAVGKLTADFDRYALQASLFAG